MVVTATVEPRAATQTTPCCAPAAPTTRATPSVMSTMWPCPRVWNRSMPLWTAMPASSGLPQPAKAPLADLEDRAVQALGGEVLLVGTERLPVEADPSLLEQPAALGPRQPGQRLQQRRQVHGAVHRLGGGVLELLPRLSLRVPPVGALLGALPARLVLGARHQPAPPGPRG